MAINYNDYLGEFHQGYNDNYRSETWTVTLAIPRDVWDTDAWGSMPARGSAPPVDPNEYPAGLAIAATSTLLDRSCDFKSEPGWVLVTLIYGYDFTSVGINRAYVTGRTVLLQRPIPNKIGGVLLIGEKTTQVANKAVITYMDISPGFPREYEESLQLIRLHAYVDEAKLKLTAGALQHLGGALHNTTWSILGKTHAAYTMKYNGCQFDVYQHGSSPTYIARFDFLIKWTPWVYNVQATEYDWVVLKADQLDTAGAIVGKKGMRARRVKTVSSANAAFRPLANFSTTLNSLIN